MRPDDLELVIDMALGELPVEVQAQLEHVEILVVQDHQDPLCAEHTAETPDFRGLFVGTQLRETFEHVAADDPSLKLPAPEGAIYLNAATIEDQDQAVITLHHEIGHALGLSEEEVTELGLDEEAEETTGAAPEKDET